VRKNLPLTALRAFEAVARLKSISSAADELNVTRPAVSKQVSQLEASLEISLLLRAGNAIRLTPAGKELFDGLQRSFDIMASTVEGVSAQSRQSNRLRILVCRDFASSWLAAHVGAFLVENSGVALEVTSENNGNLRLDENFDFRIFYGMAGQFAKSGLSETQLCKWVDIPVCTPSFAHQYFDGTRKPCEAPFLIDANYDIWDEWCSYTGFDLGGSRKHTTVFNETTLCLSVATTGGGLTFGDSFLTLPAIISGDLISPFPFGLVSSQNYSLYTSTTGRSSRVARKFEAWLRGAINSYEADVLRALGERHIKVITRD
jgi:LysR family glycine cleavage system transcriptional activator/LysR family transcriptional regulator of beta-lactamase